MAEVASEIRRRRKALHLTQMELADKAGISQSALSDIENVKRTKKPNIETVSRIARVLQCSVADLLGEASVFDAPAPVIEEYTSTEKALIADFRSLSRQGKEFILQTMLVAKNTYSQGDIAVSVVEAV